MTPITSAVFAVGTGTVVVVEVVPGPEQVWVATVHRYGVEPPTRRFVADQIGVSSEPGELALAVSMSVTWGAKLAFELGAVGDYLHLLGGVISTSAWTEVLEGLLAIEKARVGVMA